MTYPLTADDTRTARRSEEWADSVTDEEYREMLRSLLDTETEGVQG